MITFFLIISSAAIFASVVALYILIIASFSQKEKTEPDEQPHFIKRDSRIIKVNKSTPQNDQQVETINTQVSSLLWTVISGQFVGIYFFFVFIPGNDAAFVIMRINAMLLLLASFICSFLTMANGWMKKRMVISFRLIFQIYSLLVALILFRLGIGSGITFSDAIHKAGVIPDFIVNFYFLTVIIALALMLLDSSTFRKQEKVDYNYSIYFLIVVGVGMVVGLSLKILLSVL